MADSNKNKKKKRRKKMTAKQKRITIITAISGAVAVFAMGIYIKATILDTKPFMGDNGEISNNLNSNVVKSSSVDSSSQATPSITDERRLNILMLAFDEKETNTDVMLVASFDIKDKTLSLLQIPRDTYVGVGETGKINGVYTLGDKNLTPINRVVKTINEQFKLEIDHYMTCNLTGFKDIIDDLGGIPINVPQKIVYDPSKILYPGEQVLTGRQAEWFVRYRHGYSEGDIGREKMQRVFYAAAMNKAKDIKVLDIISAFKEIQKYCQSDMTIKELEDVIYLGQNLEMEDASIYMVPGEAFTYKGYSIWTAHTESTADMLNKHFRSDGETVSADELGLVELRNTIDKYEDTDDNLQELLDGVKPGEKAETTTSSTSKTDKKNN